MFFVELAKAQNNYKVNKKEGFMYEKMIKNKRLLVSFNFCYTVVNLVLMKNKKIIAIFLLLGFYQLSFAQTLGLKTGILFNNVDIKITNGTSLIGDKKPESYKGYQLGVMYKKRMNKFFSLKTELSYMVKGGNNFFGFDRYNIRLHYVSFSALAMFQVVKNGTIDIGMEPNLLTRKNIIFDRFDFGLIGGGSYLIKNKVELSVRYFYGLIPLFSLNLTDDSGDDAGTLKYFNRNLMVTVGYYFL